MSDDLDIRGGGAVAVDTQTLRTAADGFESLATELDEIAASVGSSALRLFAISPVAWEVSPDVEAVRRLVLVATDDARALASALRDTAAVYEVVELRAERAAADAAGDSVAVARIDARLDALAREHPDAQARATMASSGHWLTWPAELARQAPGILWWLAPGFHGTAIPAAWALQRAVGTLGAGTVSAAARLSGPVRDVVVTSIAVRGPATPPASLAAAADRIPRGGDARVRVERYTMPDGSRTFAVYVAGTQTTAPQTREPFDMASNVELYTGERSASFDATLEALERAGAKPGDTVHAFGHSQGAMVAAHLALEGGYDTQTLVSFGSPIEADVGDGTLSVSLRHDDDPVAALAAGGHAGSVGAPGSFIAERTADPLLGLHDLRNPAHGIEQYTQTAQLLDASEDARMTAVRQVFDDLGTATSVEVTEYSAERILPVPQPRPQRAPAAPVSPYASGAG